MDTRTSESRDQKVMEISLHRKSEDIEEELNSIAEDGFSYGGMMRFLDRAGGGIYVIKTTGVYTFRLMLWLDPAYKPSTFHVHRFMKGRKRMNLAEKVFETTAYENENGFLLRECLSLDGFVSKYDYRHPGTAGCFMLFEKSRPSNRSIIPSGSLPSAP